MLYCVEQFKAYIYNRRFNIYPDHKPLTWAKKPQNNKRVLKWRHKMSDMDLLFVTNQVSKMMQPMHFQGIQ